MYAFQGRNHLAVDGVVGPNTHGALANPDENLSVQCDAAVAAMIRDVFPNSVEDKAVRVATCESGLNPIAVGGPNGNGTLDFGVPVQRRRHLAGIPARGNDEGQGRRRATRSGKHPGGARTVAGARLAAMVMRRRIASPNTPTTGRHNRG